MDAHSILLVSYWLFCQDIASSECEIMLHTLSFTEGSSDITIAFTIIDLMQV